MGDSRVSGTPSAITVNFIGRVTPGADIVLTTTLLGASRSIQHWRSELTVKGSSEIAACATVVVTSRRPNDSLVQPQMPDVPGPDGLELFHPPGSFGQQSPVRQGLGVGFEQGSHLGESHSAAWVREISGRPIDFLQIAYLCDNAAPRAFYLGKGARPSATVTYSVYFLATAEELAEVGDDFTLMDVIGTRAEASTVGSRVNLWQRNGRLLATSEQLCWYR